MARSELMSSPRTAGTMRARGMTAARKFPSAACTLRLQGNHAETQLSGSSPGNIKRRRQQGPLRGSSRAPPAACACKATGVRHTRSGQSLKSQER